MRIVFMGTPEYAVPSLEKLHEVGYQIVGVFTQPDKPSGRGKKILFSPVKQKANELGIPVFQPKRIRVDGLVDLQSLQPDLCVTAAFGQILSQEILDIPSMGTVNVHASLLPAYRGSSPIPWCILNGEHLTGVTTMMTDAGIDTGDILLQKECAIEPGDTTETLTVKLSQLGAELLIETIRRLEENRLVRKPQDHDAATYFPKLTKEMRALDLNKPAEALVNQVRAFDPWPGSTITIGGEELKVWKAESIPTDSDACPGTVLCADIKNGLQLMTGKDALRLKEVQAAGGKRMAASDYLRGHPIKVKHVNEE